jgi:general secretion pathway protein K
MKRRAFVFIITLMTLVALVGIVSVAASSAESNFKARRNRMEKREADLAIQAAIQQAMATLANETTTSSTSTSTLGTSSSTPGGGTSGSTTPTDTDETQDWYLLGTTGADVFHVGNTTFREVIVDAASLVNLNTAPQAQLQELPLTQQQIDSLTDWISAGETPSPQGAKDAFYNALPNPYNAHLVPLTSLDELLQVQGFTYASIYQPQQTISGSVINNDDGTEATLYDLCTVDSQSKSSGSNINTATAQQLVRSGVSQANANRIAPANGRRPNLTTMGAVLRLLSGGNAMRDAVAILNNYQVGTSTTLTGRINLNTAPDTVLNTIPGMTPAIVQEIVSMQQSGITSLGSITSVSGVTLNALSQFVDSITVNSTRYAVRIEATAGTTTESAEAIVDTSGTTPQLIRIDYPPNSDMSQQWDWNDAQNDIYLDSSTGQGTTGGGSSAGGQS